MKHFNIVFLFLLSVLFLAATATMALAQGTLPAPDPSADPGAFLDAVRGAYASSKLLAVVLVLWGVSRSLFYFRDKVHFLSSPKRRALLTGAMGVLSAAAVSLVPPVSGAVFASSVMSAIAAAFALYLTPEPKAKVDA